MIKFTLSAAIGLAAVTTVSGAVVFSTDFNSGVPSQFTGATTTSDVQGYAGAYPGSTFTGDMLVNKETGNPQTATTLTLTGLPAHTTVSLGFLFATIDSWDGTSAYIPVAPDYFNVTIDGSSVFCQTFTTFPASAGNYQSYPASKRLFLANLGFSSNPSWNESAYDMATEPAFQNIRHSGSTLTVSFFASGIGWQGGDDEFWGIDNLQVSMDVINAVPEPSTYLAGLSALWMLGLSAWRSRKL